MAPWVMHWQKHGFLLMDNRASHDRRRWMCVLECPSCVVPNPRMDRCLWSTIMGYMGFGYTCSLICLLLTCLRRPCDSRRCVLGEVGQLIYSDLSLVSNATHTVVLNGYSRSLSRHGWVLLEAVLFYSPWWHQHTPKVCMLCWLTHIAC